MGMLRITPRMMVDRTLNNIAFQTRNLLKLQEQLSTQKRINAPSDDPMGTRRAINIRTLIAKTEQYSSNITSAGPQLLESETAVQTVLDNLSRARELTLRGASSTIASNQLEAIAKEINQILEGMLSTANHITNGRYIFGGTRTGAAPFVATRNAAGEITDVTYAGNTTSIKTAIGDGLEIEVSENGESAFLVDQDVFQSLIDVRDNLRANDTNALRDQRIAELDVVRNQLLRSIARVGSIQNRLNQTQTELDDFKFELESVLSETIDADYTEVVVNLNAQSNAYQAALSAAARVLQPSLLDYVQ